MSATVQKEAAGIICDMYLYLVKLNPSFEIKYDDDFSRSVPANVAVLKFSSILCEEYTENFHSAVGYLKDKSLVEANGDLLCLTKLGYDHAKFVVAAKQSKTRQFFD